MFSSKIIQGRWFVQTLMPSQEMETWYQMGLLHTTGDYQISLYFTKFRDEVDKENRPFLYFLVVWCIYYLGSRLFFFLYKLVTSIFLFFFALCLKNFKFKTSQIQVRQETTRLYLGSFYLSSIKLNCSGFIQNKIKTNCKKGLYNVSPAKMSELRILMLAANRKGESKGESKIQHIICLVDQWKKH